MLTIRNFEEARQALRPLYEAYTDMGKGGIYTLDRIQALLAHIGNPQNTLKVIHVAGTSGKTSTAYYVAALLEVNRCRVGLSVSPHVIEMNERIQINRIPLPEKEYCDALGEFMDIVAASGIRLTYFELKVALMFYEVAKRGVDYAVVEVGVGGLVDGTNVVSREDKVCVITDIGFDHTNLLGNTLKEIAAQKAGIIQPHNHVFMYEQSSEIMTVVQNVCSNKAATLHSISPLASEQHEPTQKLPTFQRRNFHLAAEAVSYIVKRDGRSELTPQQLRTATEALIPGRMEIVRINEKTIIFDGAHNEQKMTALIKSIEDTFPNQTIAALVTFSKAGAERWQPAVAILAAHTKHLIVTSFDLIPQDQLKASLPAEEIAQYLNGRVPVTVEPDLATACHLLIGRPESILLVTGSLYVLKEAQAYIRSLTSKIAE